METQNEQNMEGIEEQSNENMDLEPKLAGKLKKFFKRPIVIASSIIIILIIAGIVYGKATNKPEFNYIKSERGTIVQEVGVTGKVKPAESVDLGFEVSGKVNRVYAKVGDRVSRGQYLVSLSSGESASDLSQARANLAVEQARLDELKAGTREEEVAKAETALENAKTQADANLRQDYDAALTAIQEAAVIGKNALITLSDLQFEFFLGNEQEDLEISGAKRKAVFSMLGLDNAGNLVSEEISKLDGGAYEDVINAVQSQSYEDIDLAISNLLNALQDIKSVLDLVPIKTSFSATNKSDLSTAKTNIASEITTVSSKQQAIAVLKVTNSNSIETAQKDLDLKRAGSTKEQIDAQEARVLSALASVQNIEAKLAKRTIVAPISGVITKQDAKVGEIISANTELVSLSTASNFEVETFIPEVDITKVSVGDMAKITLDAYGNDIVFMATVVSVEPGETVIEGVSTYKTILQFTEDDDRIKSGMTANIDIETDKRKDVIFVPARAVITKDGKRYIKILENGTTSEIEVKTGIRGSKGEIEILEGLEEGEKVII